MKRLRVLTLTLTVSLLACDGAPTAKPSPPSPDTLRPQDEGGSSGEQGVETPGDDVPESGAEAPSTRVTEFSLSAPGRVTASGDIRQFPWLAAVGETLLVGYSQHLDGYLPEPIYDGLSVSRDGGASFPEYVQQSRFTLTSMAHLRSGELLGVSYITRKLDAFRSRCDIWRTPDLGRTWNHQDCILHAPVEQGVIGSDWGGLLFHRTVMEGDDGTLYATVYGRYLSDGPTNTRVVWVKSTDNGANWHVVSTMAFDPSPTAVGWSEPVVARVADGSLLAIFRIGELEMRQGRSYDNGLTWSAPTPIPGVAEALTRSVDPDLVLTSDGVLVLSYGRPGTSMLLSPDGSGYSWERYVATEKSATTGYTGVRETAPGKLVLVGDYGKWRNPYEIWRRDIALRARTIPGTRLDLASMLKIGTAKVATNMTFTDERGLPGSGVGGAFDRSLEYSRSAFKSGTDGAAELTLTLDRVYQVRSLGVLLKVGYPENAEVWFSNDGVNWNEPVKTFRDANQAAVDYTTFASPLSARFVRLRISASGWPGLNELELFVDDAPTVGRDTFERTERGGIPPGYALLSGTAEVAGANPGRALRIFDTSNEAMSRVVRRVPVATSKRLRFTVRPTSLSAGALVSLVQGERAGIHLSLMPSGALAWFDGARWQKLTADGAVPLNVSTPVRVEATTTGRASVYLGDVFVGTAGAFESIGAFDGVVFSSGGTAAVGDDFTVDDVEVN